MKITRGSTSVDLGDGLEISERAGTMTDKEVEETPKAYPDCAKTGTSMAQTLRSYPDRFKIEDVTAEQLELASQMSEAIELVERDVQAALKVVSQGRLLIDAELHLLLRKLNSYVKARKSFDPELPALAQAVIDYWAKKKASSK